jgi:aminoglycoside 3-N-acetyltransferase
MYDADGKTVVTRLMIAEGLRRIGLREGDLVQVHSSLSAFGYVEGGARAVLNALLDVLGREGTLMMPTFNHGRYELFDVRNTPSVNGAITEALRTHQLSRRSVHPTHPYGAIGPLADWLVEGHLAAGTFGDRSPLGKLATVGGYVLLLGVGMEANTAAHIGEVLASCPCIGLHQARRRIVDALGNVVEIPSSLWRDGKCLIEWEALETYMRERDQIHDDTIGDANVHLMRAADVVGGAFKLAQSLCPQCPTGMRQSRPESE